jgi:hypothetical protein
MGVQSMDEDFKNKLKRYERTDHIKLALQFLNKHGIRVKVDHMFGLPGEPIEAQEKALSLYIEYVPARIQTFWTCFLPGTELMKEGLAEGIITKLEADRLNDGIDFYFYRDTNNIKNPALVKAYNAYDFLFKIMPILPKFIRVRLKASHVQSIPSPFKKTIGYIADVITGFIYKNPDFEAYARHYLFKMYTILLQKLGITSPSARKINLRSIKENKASPLVTYKSSANPI